MCWVAEDSRGGIVTEKSYDDCNMAGFLSFMVDLSWCEFELRDGNCSVFKSFEASFGSVDGALERLFVLEYLMSLGETITV